MTCLEARCSVKPIGFHWFTSVEAYLIWKSIYVTSIQLFMSLIRVDIFFFSKERWIVKPCYSYIVVSCLFTYLNRQLIHVCVSRENHAECRHSHGQHQWSTMFALAAHWNQLRQTMIAATIFRIICSHCPFCVYLFVYGGEYLWPSAGLV